MDKRKKELTMFKRIVSLIFLIVGIASLCSCSKKDTPAIVTGQTISIPFSPPVYVAKTTYNVVSRDWAATSYDTYRAYIAEGAMGVVAWDDLTLCTWFATSYSVWAQKQTQAYGWYHSIPVPQIAVGVIWYTTRTGGGHAINVLYTERGREYFEPQNGQFVTLTEQEVASIWFEGYLN